MARIQELPEVKFGSESAGAYHAEKHGDPGRGELPPGELKGDKVGDYLASAQKIIKNPTTTDVRVNQDGTRPFKFVREVTEGGKKYSMTAYVHCGDDGSVALASYMGLVSK